MAKTKDLGETSSLETSRSRVYTGHSKKTFLLTDSVDQVPLIGPKQTENLKRLGIFTVKDLLFHFPVRYRDTSQIIPISELLATGEGTILGTVKSVKTARTRRGFILTKALIEDETGSIPIIWFNQIFIEKALKSPSRFIFECKLPSKPGSKEFQCKTFEAFDEDRELTHVGRITPFYDQTEGISSKWLRSRLSFLLKQANLELTDTLEKQELEKYNLITLQEAIHKIHFPESYEDIELARKRLGFDEMLEVAAKIEKRIQQDEKFTAHEIKSNKIKINEFISTIEFALTSDQKNAIAEILEDLQRSEPMKRLLNGDVGSGKTIVAAVAAYTTYLAGYSTIIMAPTTILAQQHYRSFQKIFEGRTSLTDKNTLEEIKVQLLTSGKALEPTLKSQIIIGTQAILYEEFLPENTGLIIVDEQHRFGVEQRENVRIPVTAENIRPHYLSMTATPIPRTLASILYGDMKVSLIKQMPKNRIPIKSYLVPVEKSNNCYKWVAEKISSSNHTEQAFIIFPLVEGSEKVDAKAAVIEYENLSKTVFKDLKVGLLHGQMKEVDKDQILKDFKDKKLDILVATSVVEVGIDIPDATIMLIENAERFGLAQLHQFRGRIGRGDKQAHCFVLLSQKVGKTSTSYKRLKYFVEHSSGFEVAEYDLKLRGPGEVYGLKQSGIPDLKIASINDLELLQVTREAVRNKIKTTNVEQVSTD